MRVEGDCRCDIEPCPCSDGKNHTWVDSGSGLCRTCEIEDGRRWGHHTARAEPGRQIQRENII